MTTSYLYDTLSRVSEIQYPAQYGLTGSPRKIVQQTYDNASRLSTLKYNGMQQAGDIVYNAAGQTTSINIGAAGANQVNQNYTFDAQTGLLTNQKVQRSSQTLLDLSYDYNRGGSVGNLNGKTGSLTKILNNLDHNKDRTYEYDALGRLTKAKGGATSIWQQSYAYDRFGNRTSVAATGVAADNTTMPSDGIPNLAYDTNTNRITTSGFQYDLAGNQIRALSEDGVTWLNFEYDTANQVRVIKRDDGTAVQGFLYGASGSRLMNSNQMTGEFIIYANLGGTTLAEYTEYTYAVPTWTKSFTYLGDSLLSIITLNGTSEVIDFNHPDQLGTRVITNQQLGTSYEQNTLPFGTALNAESTAQNNKKRFTNYDRSSATGLDYAVNRTYDSKQGRFTQVDPIGMRAGSLQMPQTLNLYVYCGNDPINRTDPSGLFWGAIGRFFKKLLQVLVIVAIVVALVVLVYVTAGLAAIGVISGWVAAGIYAVGGLLALKLGAYIHTGINELFDQCRVPKYGDLSQGRQDELAQRGVSPEQWNHLRNKQRLGYFNITTAIAAAGLSLLGWLVDWAAGGIQQDRTFFIQGQGATNLLAQVRSSSIFSRDINNGGSHPGYEASYRQNTFLRSTQLSFSPDGRRLEADIDFFNPNRIPGGTILHLFEVITHSLGKVLGGTRTNPYNVAYRSSWECK